MSNAQNLHDLEAIDAVAAAFEEAWRTTPMPSISEYADRLAPALRPTLLRELIRVDADLRAQTGMMPRPQEYEDAFPEAGWDQAFRTEIAGLAGATAPMDATREEGVLPPTVVRSPTGSPVSAAVPGTVIGDYRLIEELKGGGQARIFRAEHRHLKHQVVLKMLREDTARANTSGALEDEGRALIQLDHPNIARVRALSEHDGRRYLVVDYIRGQTLAQLAASGPVPPRRAAELVIQVAEALRAAHAMGILHRDLKPQNILVDETGSVKVIDFGLARLNTAWSHEPPDAGTISGTLPYMAPEQAQGTGQTDQRADIFSAGAVLYFLLVGHAPYHGGDRRTLLPLVQEGAFDVQSLRRANVPKRLRRICLKAMAVDPADRYFEATELSLDLQRAAPRGFSRSGWAIAAAIVAVALASGALLLFTQDPSPPTTHVAPPLAPARLAASVERNDRLMNWAAAAPLRPDDKVRVVATIPEGAHGAIVLVDSDGKAEVLAEIGPDAPDRQLVFPPDRRTGQQLERQGFRLDPGNGTVMLLAVARRSRPYSAADLQPALETWPSVDEGSLLAIYPDRLDWIAKAKGVSAVTTMSSSDPDTTVWEAADRVRRLVAAEAGTVSGVAFRKSSGAGQ